jgi:hypothetical protein
LSRDDILPACATPATLILNEVASVSCRNLSFILDLNYYVSFIVLAPFERTSETSSQKTEKAALILNVPRRVEIS